LYKYNQKKDGFTKVECKIKSEGSTPQKIRVLYEDKNNIFWIGTEAGLYKFNLEKEKFIQDTTISTKTKTLMKKQITSINRDSEGRLWVGTLEDGLYISNPLTNEFVCCKNEKCKSGSLSHNEVISIYEDVDSGLVWIGTNGGGLNIFDPFRKKFELYNNISGSNDIVAICNSNDGGVWVGTFGGGLKKFNPGDKKFTDYKIPVTASKDADRDRISAVYEEKTGKVWVGTDGAGLFQLTPETKKIERHKNINLRKEEKVSTIFEDHFGALWIGTLDSGLIRLDKDRKNSKNYKNVPGNKKSLSDNAIYAILEDSDNVLWIGTGSGGLNKFDRQNKTFSYHFPSAKKSNSISHNFITVLYEDTHGILWIGTNGGGLNKFDKTKTKEIFTAYTTQDGLPNNVIYSILEDGSGCLWISTNKGLSRFNPKTIKFRNYSVRDGLQGYEFNRGSAWKSESGKMYFGGVNGFNVFDPATLKKKDRTAIPPIVITSFKRYNQEEKLPISITEIKELELSYRDKSVSFEFAALSFADSGSNQYAYKLEPVNKEWIGLGNKHDVDLINLKPGKYTFRVKGANNDGIWNEEGASIKIEVTPPFWQTWYSYTLLVILISSIIFGLVKWRFNITEKANKQLKKEVDQRKEAEELYRNLVETSPDSITLSEIETEKIFMANHQTANLLGYSSVEELRKKIKNIFDIFFPNDRKRAKINAEKIKDNSLNKSTEYTLLSKDGELIDVEMSTSLIRDADKKPRYFLSITRDVRERKDAERKKSLEREKMVHIDKMVSLGTLVSGVSHELNNPLASIKMNADSFAKVWQDVIPVLDLHYKKNQDFSLAKVPYELSKPRFRDLITGLVESGLRIEKIINTLKDFSRPGEASAKQSIDINKVIESSVKLTDNMIRKSTDRFSFKPGRNLPPLVGNFQRLEQVFINLIQNACQALADKTKKIKIETIYQKRNKQIEIRVEDEGKGIAEKDRKHIMDLFYTTRRDSGGTGIGLAISSQILREHGGSINIESEVGQGTIITIKLPMG
jgi:PAS domain S-box-containing protein